MELNRAIVTGGAVRRARAMAEFDEWSFVVTYHAARVAEIDRTDEMPLGKELGRREVTLELAQAMQVSEHQVWAMVSEAEVLTRKTPGVWAAFRAGDIDGVRVTAIARTAEQLQTAKALEQLEQSAPEYAATHTVAELRAWLRRLRARLEPEQADEETARAEIAISIAATDLIGYTEGPGTTLDGEPISPAWVRELAASEHTILRRLVLDPMGHVLDTSILGYRPSQRLRDAVKWRDGICRVIGCRAPAHETDQDHALAYHSGGETSGDNLRSLCRKHHNMKSHGHLHDHHLDTPTRHFERYEPCPPTPST